MAGDATQTAAAVLAEVVPRLSRIIANALSRDPALRLSLRQYRMLERLLERPHRTTELAWTSGVTQPTASAAVAALVARRLVERSADPEDGRATLLRITRDGEAMLAAARDCVLARLREVTREVDAEDAAALERVLPVLLAGMDRMRVEAAAPHMP